MSITDELREWAEKNECKSYCKLLTDIADRIDAEHERQCAESWMRGHDAWAAIDRSDAMAEHGWIRLPVDANGVPFRIGDKVGSDHYEDGTIIGVNYFKAPNGVVREEIAVQPNGWDAATWRDPEEYAHHHEPTVEDVLLEACKAYHSLLIEGMSDVAHDMPAPFEIIAEYATKLTLRGDE